MQCLSDYVSFLKSSINDMINYFIAWMNIDMNEKLWLWCLTVYNDSASVTSIGFHPYSEETKKINWIFGVVRISWVFSLIFEIVIGVESYFPAFIYFFPVKLNIEFSFVNISVFLKNVYLKYEYNFLLSVVADFWYFF